jgi:DNA-binding NarL/FixJ family response regulator
MGLVIDVSAVVRWGLEAILRRHGVASVAAASTASEAVALVRRSTSAPSIALVGLVDDQHVTDLVGALTRGHDCPVIALLPEHQMRLSISVLQAGARAVIERDARTIDMTSTIDAAMSGLRYISPGLIDALATPQPSRPGSPRLTVRERQVLDSLVAGRTNGEIASRLFISEETVKTHVSNLFHKLGVRSRSEAVAVALRLSLV